MENSVLPRSKTWKDLLKGVWMSAVIQQLSPHNGQMNVSQTQCSSCHAWSKNSDFLLPPHPSFSSFFLSSFTTSSLLSQLPSGLSSCLSSFFLIYLLIYVLSFLPCLLSTDKGKPFPRGGNQSTEEGHHPTHAPNIVCNTIMRLWHTEAYWRGVLTSFLGEAARCCSEHSPHNGTKTKGCRKCRQISDPEASFTGKGYEMGLER